MKQYSELFPFLICVGTIAVLAVIFFNKEESNIGNFTAKITVIDRYGKPVNVKPNVVCMAERPNEICRVESVR